MMIDPLLPPTPAMVVPRAGVPGEPGATVSPQRDFGNVLAALLAKPAADPLPDAGAGTDQDQDIPEAAAEVAADPDQVEQMQGAISNDAMPQHLPATSSHGVKADGETGSPEDKARMIDRNDRQVHTHADDAGIKSDVPVMENARSGPAEGAETSGALMPPAGLTDRFIFEKPVAEAKPHVSASIEHRPVASPSGAGVFLLTQTPVASFDDLSRTTQSNSDDRGPVGVADADMMLFPGSPVQARSDASRQGDGSAAYVPVTQTDDLPLGSRLAHMAEKPNPASSQLGPIVQNDRFSADIPGEILPIEPLTFSDSRSRTWPQAEHVAPGTPTPSAFQMAASPNPLITPVAMPMRMDQTEHIANGPGTDVDFTLSPRGSDAVAPTNTGTAAAPGLARAVIVQIVQFAPQPGQSAVEITLNPEELGKVRLSLVAAEGVLTMTLMAERVETLDLLRRHAAELGQEYRELGYDSIDFQFQTSEERADTRGQDQQEARLRIEHGDDLPAAPVQSAQPVQTGLDIRL